MADLQVLLAVANGAWLLTPEWVTASLEAGHWLPEPPFEAKVACLACLTACKGENGRLTFAAVQGRGSNSDRPTRMEKAVDLRRCASQPRQASRGARMRQAPGSCWPASACTLPSRPRARAPAQPTRLRSSAWRPCMAARCGRAMQPAL
jgi:hypothetical protein